jgi:hypothetical protein
MNIDDDAEKTQQITRMEPFVSPPMNPYWSNPYTPPPSPQKMVRVMNVLLIVVGLLLISSIIFVGIHGIPSRQSNQPAQAQGTSYSSPSPSRSVTISPTATSSITSISPLLYQDSQGMWDCYIIIFGETNVFAEMANMSSSIVGADCSAVIGQNRQSYLSTTPQKIVGGDTLQCQGWGADNTSWKLEAPNMDLSASILCHDLSQVVPPVQG